MPYLLDTLHKVETTADAGAYLQRLDAFARGLDGETERLQRDANLGVIAPDFLLDTTLKQQTAYAAVAVADWGFVSSLARRTREHALPGDWEMRARKICETTVAPALARQIETLRALRAKATSAAGVGRLPDGEAYYRWALQVGTTTMQTPEQVHALGLEQVDAISATMDRLLREQGLSSGTVGQRMSALSSDPRFLFPNDQGGRAQLLAYLNGVIADMRSRLPRAFATLKKADLVIKRVPPSIEADAPDGYEENGPIDGNAPAIYYINLRDTANWPKFSLPTLCFHGNPVDSATGEIDRYCAWPGQACGYQIGHLQIDALRRRARAALRHGFDLRSFDDALLSSGSMPLDLLREVMERYMQARGLVP